MDVLGNVDSIFAVYMFALPPECTYAIFCKHVWWVSWWPGGGWVDWWVGWWSGFDAYTFLNGLMQRRTWAGYFS